MKVYEEFNKAAFDKWVKDKGDTTLRINYPLNEKSVVFDVGGYKGEWAKRIFDKYGCSIYIFEPVASYYNNICNKFSDNEKIHVFNYGLSDSDKELNISISNDSSSVYDTGNGPKEQIKLKSIIDFLNTNNIEKVDLIKINIEGGEYDLMEDIIKNGNPSIFRNIQVQYHRFVENCTQRRAWINEELKKTHNETYSYEFIWENWALKNDELFESVN